MSDTGADDPLAALLRDAGRAHHEAFAHANGADPEWAQWYAEYLAPRLTIDGAAGVDAATVAAALTDAEASRQKDDPKAHWPAYYARFMRARAPWRVRAA